MTDFTRFDAIVDEHLEDWIEELLAFCRIPSEGGDLANLRLAADWTASLLDQNAGGWDASPLVSRLELISLGWLRELFGLPTNWDGVLVTGGQMANFTGLAAARQWWP